MPHDWEGMVFHSFIEFLITSGSAGTRSARRLFCLNGSSFQRRKLFLNHSSSAKDGASLLFGRLNGAKSRESFGSRDFALGNEHPAAHKMHEIAFDSLFYARFQGGVFGGPFSLRLCSGQRCEGDHLGR
jgi:hypothetical protein